MKIFSSYSVKIKHYNIIFKDTVAIYRSAVDYLIGMCMEEWDTVSGIQGNLLRQQYMERLCHATADNPDPKYTGFDRRFYKFPSYLRRSAISEVIGKVSSYKSTLANWEAADASIRGRKPSFPKAGFIYPCLYKTGMYEQTGSYEARIKVYIRNTWDWITLDLRKSDVDYITRRCQSRKKCAPTLRKRGHEWYLDFPFEEETVLADTDIFHQTIAAVDLGINSTATVSIMRPDGTILGRHFCKLPREYDSLKHATNRIRKAQQHGNFKTPRLWARAKGINDDIAVKTAGFIIDTAVLYNADTIVFEHLDRKGKKRGSGKQKLHLWRSQYVQSMVEHKAHRIGMHVSRICAWGTSRLAFDGSGRVLRGREADLESYSVCQFRTGKVYNCDLNASYNIGARYYIREILKSVPVKVRLALEAKVPQAARRSTCTLSVLINLNAELVSMAA